MYLGLQTPQVRNQTPGSPLARYHRMVSVGCLLVSMGWEDKRGYYRCCGLSTSLVWSLIDFSPWWFHVSGPGMKRYIIVEELGGVKLFPSAARKQRAVSELNHDTNNKGPQRLTLNDLLPPARPHPLQFYCLPVIYSKSESIIGLNY